MPTNHLIILKHSLPIHGLMECDVTTAAHHVVIIMLIVSQVYRVRHRHRTTLLVQEIWQAAASAAPLVHQTVGRFVQEGLELHHFRVRTVVTAVYPC